MAFGETAGGVEAEAAAAKEAAVEALDESSSDVDLDPREMKVRRKSRKLRQKRTRKRGRLDKKEWMPLSHLKKLPSALKRETDRLRGDKNDQVLSPGVLVSMGFLLGPLIAGDTESTRDGSVATS